MTEAQKAGAPARTPRKAAGSMNVNILLKTHWHQTWPYNEMCPIMPDDGSHALTGCVATAAAQVLYYWRNDLNERTQYVTPVYTANTEAPVKTSVKKGTPLKWDLLKTSYTGKETKEYTDAVALVNYVIGTCAKMNYGHSSGAYIADLVDPYQRQFGLASKNVWKNTMNQAAWEKLIYEDLLKQHPIVFAGYTPEWEGHAIVLDGYQSRSNLFHFNFGWGGQGDGWYTLDDETGVNGFGMEQSITYDIHPINLNTDVTIQLRDNKLRSKLDNTVKVNIKNNSTLPIQNIYMFSYAGTTKPTNLNRAIDSNTTTIISSGKSADFEFTFRPTGTSKQTIYITDEELNILGKLGGITQEATVADMELLATAVDDGGTSEKQLVGETEVDVQHVYSSQQLTAYATLRQSTQGTACQPSLYGYIYQVEDDGNEVQVKTTTIADDVFQPGETRVVAFSFSGLTDGARYRFTIGNTAHATKSSEIRFATADSCTYFKLVGPNMVAEDAGEEVRLSGNYNSQQFNLLTANPAVARYDVSALRGLPADLRASNPNALFYAEASQQVAGRNIVVDGVCAELRLEAGHNFSPREDFKALQASMITSGDEAGRFSTVCLPFSAPVPNGLFARRVRNVGTNYLDQVDSCNVTLEACTPYLIIGTRASEITANSVDVSVTKSSTGSEAFAGTFLNIPADDGMMLLDDEATQYFAPADGQTIPALTAYLLAEKKIRAISLEYSAKDKKTIALAEGIIEAGKTLRLHEFDSTPKALSTLLDSIASAEATLTQQPGIDSLTAVTKNLKTAIEDFIAARVMTDKDGHADVTSLIVNPSFETGASLTGWTKKNASSTTLTTEANFLSGADGARVAYIKKDGSIEQTITGIEDGEYILTFKFAADYGNHITVYAGETAVTDEATDFGPHYMKQAASPSFHVNGGQLTIAVYAEEDWVKVDDIRLYQVYSDAIEQLPAPQSPTLPAHRRGLFDLQGRRLQRVTHPGIYIKDGKLMHIQ